MMSSVVLCFRLGEGHIEGFCSATRTGFVGWRDRKADEPLRANSWKYHRQGAWFQAMAWEFNASAPYNHECFGAGDGYGQ